MSLSHSATRRRLCLALPIAMLTAATGGLAHAQSLLTTTPARIRGTGGYEVTLNLDLFGESSQHVLRAWNTERVAVDGKHGDTPWRLEFIITRVYGIEQLMVSSRLTSAAELLAAPVRTISLGQRVVVRADDAMNVAMLIKKV